MAPFLCPKKCNGIHNVMTPKTALENVMALKSITPVHTYKCLAPKCHSFRTEGQQIENVTIKVFLGTIAKLWSLLTLNNS